jgi:hypothetical protein
MQRADGTVEVTGIVDWENARTVGIPECDLIHLWHLKAGEPGTAVRRAAFSDTVRRNRRIARFSNPIYPQLIWCCWPGCGVSAELGELPVIRSGALAGSQRQAGPELLRPGDAPRVLMWRDEYGHDGHGPGDSSDCARQASHIRRY